MDRVILKCIWKSKGTRVAKAILKKKNKEGGLGLSNFKTYIATIIKRALTKKQAYRSMEWCRGPRNCYIYSQLNFDKVAKVMEWKKNCALNK